MPSYADLQSEACYRAEFSPPALTRLCNGLRTWRPSSEIGQRGDNHHLNGAHRSRRWIKESRWCTNRTYTVSRTEGDRSGGNSNWYVGVDAGGLAQLELFEMCRRLDTAIKAGRLEKITEWYGNFGDDDRVDGFDNIANRLASSDSSHLKHLHMTFDRGRADEDHSDVLAVLIGQGDDDGMLAKCKHGDKGTAVVDLQDAIVVRGGDLSDVGGVDGDYGDGTARELAKLVGGDGHTFGIGELLKLTAGAGGGGKGDKGDDGRTPTKVRLVLDTEVDATVVAYADPS